MVQFSKTVKPQTRLTRTGSIGLVQKIFRNCKIIALFLKMTKGSQVLHKLYSDLKKVEHFKNSSEIGLWNMQVYMGVAVLFMRCKCCMSQMSVYIQIVISHFICLP